MRAMQGWTLGAVVAKGQRWWTVVAACEWMALGPRVRMCVREVGTSVWGLEPDCFPWLKHHPIP